MKKIIKVITSGAMLVVSTALLATSVPAPIPSHGSGVGVGVSSENITGSAANNQGVSAGVTFNNSGPSSQTYKGGYKIETVPSVAAPSLTTTFSET